MKIRRLEIEHTYDFDLYAVVSSVKEYKLAWALNKLLDLRLIKQKDLCYELLGKGHLLISNYLYATEYSQVRLLRNKALGTANLKKPFLLPDIKEYDYVLQITGGLQQLYPQELIQKILRTPLVEYVCKIDPRTLKFKENLIF